jgi:hypothetical protein
LTSLLLSCTIKYENGVQTYLAGFLVIAERTVEHGVQRLNGLFPTKANLRYRINPVLRIWINRISEPGSGTGQAKKVPETRIH